MKENSPLNPAHPPEILVFKVTPVAPAVNLNSQCVFTLDEIFGDIKFSRSFAILTITHKLLINPHIKCGCDSPEMKKNLLIFPIRRNFKLPLI